MLRDLCFAWRALRRSPWYALTVAGVLTAGISLTTVTFAVVDGVLFKPLPYPNADELYLIRADATGDPREAPPAVSWAEITAWRAAVPDVTIGVASVSSSRAEQVALRDHYSADVDERFLDVLGVRPLAGGFSAADFERAPGPGDREYPRLISYALWRSAHGADPAIIGRSVLQRETQSGRSSTRVAGILPANFVFPVANGQEQPEVLERLFAPVTARLLSTAQARTLQAIVRVSPDQLPRVHGRLLDATLELAREAPPDPLGGHAAPQLAPPFDRIELVPLVEHLGRDARPALAMTAAAAGLLLGLACLNVAGLAAARSVEREREHAVRRAIGASTWRLARGQLAELLLLVGPALLLALLVSRPLLATTIDLLPASLGLLKTPAIDFRVLVASGGIAAISLLLIALWPTRIAHRLAPGTALSRGTSGASKQGRSIRALVVVQTAAGFVLLTAAALTAASLVAVWTEDTGYRRDRLALLETYASFYTSQQESTDQLLDTLRLLRNTPGVNDVAVTSIQPLFESASTTPYSLWVPQTGASGVSDVSSRLVTSNYFQVMGLDLVEGTWPDQATWEQDAPVALVSESAARAWWPDRSALGQLLVSGNERLRATTMPRVVVGVVRDARYSALDREPIRDLYVPNPIQLETYGVIFLVRTTGPVDDVMASLLQVLSVHRLRVAQALSFRDALFKSVRHRALPAWLFGLLGGSGLVILGAGILGMLAMSVSQRTREMGIRLALGSTGAGIVRLIVGEQVRPVMLGLLAGTAVSTWAVGFLESQLYGVNARDPGVWVMVAATILATAVVGALVPSIRSAMTSPVTALRSE